MARPLSDLLKKYVEWCWTSTAEEAFKAVKEIFLHAPNMALTDSDRLFNVFSDDSNIFIGCALLQTEVEGRERDYLQLKAYDKELSS